MDKTANNAQGPIPIRLVGFRGLNITSPAIPVVATVPKSTPSQERSLCVVCEAFLLFVRKVLKPEKLSFRAAESSKNQMVTYTDMKGIII